MVALAIMSVTVVAIFQVYSASLRSVKKADDNTNALIHARAFMDEAYTAADPSGLSASKEFKPYYTVKRSVVMKSVSEDKKAKLYEITVTVTWPPSGNLTLKGLRSLYAPEE
jgi:type II secretory pathway pseudopilin PulG